MTVKALRKLLHGLSPEAEVQFLVEHEVYGSYRNAEVLGATHENEVGSDRVITQSVVITLRCEDDSLDSNFNEDHVAERLRGER